MAVKVLRKNLDRFDFSGLSGDSKPTTCNYGSTFYVTDLGDLYVYTGAGWVLKYTLVKLSAGSLNIGDIDIASIAAGETHIGEVGGNTFLIPVTPVIGAAAFTAGDFVGGKLTLANAGRVAAGSGIVHSLSIVDAAKQAAALRIYLFKADLAGTYADNAVESFTGVDMLKLIDVIDVLSSDWETLANVSVTKADALRGLGIPYKITSGTSLFAIARVITAPTYTANCLQLTFGLLRD
jgi:hypothetical protein